MIYEIYYEEGFQAFHHGFDLNDNPYKRYTIIWSYWKDGWEKAKET